MRSVFARIAVTFVKIHFGGDVSGIAAMRSPRSVLPTLDATAFARSAPPATVAKMTHAFFM